MQYIKDQIKHALENQEELIKMFAAEPDKKLVDRLNIMHLQYIICEKDNDLLTGELLEIMRRIVIEARMYKKENNIPDELDEMEQAIAEMDLAQEKLEHRKKLLSKLSESEINESETCRAFLQEIKPENKADNSLQLGLF